jgi:hypothetical protein
MRERKLKSDLAPLAERWRKVTPQLGYVASIAGDVGREISRCTELVVRLPHAERLIFSFELSAPRSVSHVAIEFVGGRSHEMIDERLACRCPQVFDARAGPAQLAGELVIEVELSYEQHRVPPTAWAIQ